MPHYQYRNISGLEQTLMVPAFDNKGERRSSVIEVDAVIYLAEVIHNANFQLIEDKKAGLSKLKNKQHGN